MPGGDAQGWRMTMSSVAERPMEGDRSRTRLARRGQADQGAWGDSCGPGDPEHTR